MAPVTGWTTRTNFLWRSLWARDGAETAAARGHRLAGDRLAGDRLAGVCFRENHGAFREKRVSFREKHVSFRKNVFPHFLDPFSIFGLRLLGGATRPRKSKNAKRRFRRSEPRGAKLLGAVVPRRGAERENFTLRS